jgi:hypothetical protein
VIASYVWTVGQTGLARTNANLCELVRDWFPTLARILPRSWIWGEECAAHSVVLYLGIIGGIFGALVFCWESYRRNRSLVQNQQHQQLNRPSKGPERPKLLKGKRAQLTGPGNEAAASLKWDGHLGHTYYSSEDCTIFTQAVQLSASNVSDHEIRLEDAYIVSGETGDKIFMKVGVPGTGWIFPSETNPIPPGGTVTVRAEFNAPIGLAASDFFNKWKVMHLTTKYDRAVHRKLIDEKMVSALFAAFRPNPIGPRMTKRRDAQ